MKRFLLVAGIIFLAFISKVVAQKTVTLETYEEKSSGRSFTVADVAPHSNDAFLKHFFSVYGVKACNNGTYTWKGVPVKGVGENLTLYIIDGIWKKDKKGTSFNPLCKDDMKPLKDDEKRGIRVALFDNEEVDFLDGQAGDAFVKFLTDIISALSK